MPESGLYVVEHMNLHFMNWKYPLFNMLFLLAQSPAKLSLLPESARISSRVYKDVVDKGEPHVLVDVRPAHHFKISAIPESINIPLPVLKEKLSTLDLALKEAGHASNKPASLYVVCRRGNDSQRAVQLLNDNGFSLAKDIVGGLESWAKDVDPTFPTY